MERKNKNISATHGWSNSIPFFSFSNCVEWTMRSLECTLIFISGWYLDQTTVLSFSFQILSINFYITLRLWKIFYLTFQNRSSVQNTTISTWSISFEVIWQANHRNEALNLKRNMGEDWVNDHWVSIDLRIIDVIPSSRKM